MPPPPCVGDLGREEHQLLDPKPSMRYRVNNIMVPIFGRQAELMAGLTLLGFDEPLGPERIVEYVRSLAKATALIARSTGDRIPLDL